MNFEYFSNKEKSPDKSNNGTESIGAHMTDDERMEEYAATGDPSYLTPELAHKMQPPADVMTDILRATPEVATIARRLEEESSKRFAEFERKKLAGHCSNPDVLDNNKADTREVVENLIPLALKRNIVGVDNEDVDDIKHMAKDKLQELILRKPKEAVQALLDSVDPTKIDSLRIIDLIESLRDSVIMENASSIKKAGKDLANSKVKNIITALKTFNDANIMARFRGRMYSTTDSLAFAFARAIQFAEDMINNESYLDTNYEDMLEPFEIMHERYAVINGEGDQIYIANKELSARITEALNLNDKFTLRENNKDMFDEHTMYDDPLTLNDLRYAIMDSGDTVDEYITNTFGIGDESRQDLINDYIKILSPHMRKVIKDDFSIDLLDLNIAEQFIFLNFFKRQPMISVDKVQQFTRQYGVNGIRTFLALDKLGEDFGDLIVDIGNMFTELAEEHCGEIIFGHYVNLIDAIDGLEEYLEDTFASEMEEAVIQEVADGIRIRAANFLRGIFKQLLGNTSDTNKKIVESIKKTTDDAILFTSAFRSLKLRDQIDWEQMKNVSLESMTSFDISKAPEMRSKMQNILRENYLSSDLNYSQEFINEIMGGMEESLRSANTTWYILQKDGEVVGFNKFEEEFDENGALKHIYFGSFNVRQDFGGGKLGEAILETSLTEQKKKGVPIYAYCDPRAPITQKYFDLGFKKMGKVQVAGVLSLKIVLKPE